MFWLMNNWDGFGTTPISRKAHDVSLNLVSYIDIDVDAKIFVGVEIEGSVYFEIYRSPQRRFELTVKPDGQIEYEEIDPTKAELLNRGAFILTPENINEVLT